VVVQRIIHLAGLALHKGKLPLYQVARKETEQSNNHT
jgi:hypothetical protein